MERLGINIGLLLIQIAFVIVLFGIPIISLIGLTKKNLTGTPLAIWVLIICVVPVLGSLAFWIIRPTAEKRS